MAKKALCVGINDYPAEDNDLKGCVRDARAWGRLLHEQYDFPKSDVHLLHKRFHQLQDSQPNFYAETKALNLAR